MSQEQLSPGDLAILTHDVFDDVLGLDSEMKATHDVVFVMDVWDIPDHPSRRTVKVLLQGEVLEIYEGQLTRLNITRIDT